VKHLIILGDGMADRPVERLGGKTPLQVAAKPHIDTIARQGRCGMLHTLTDDMPTGSAVANLSVMGYDPRQCFQGRGVLEAASMGVDLAQDDLAMRCNLICLEEGRIKNHSAGHISSAESDHLLRDFQATLGAEGFRFHSGVSYRHLFVAKGLDPALECSPPHDHPGERAKDLLIQPKSPQAAATADKLNELTRRSWEFLADHPVNQARRAAGKDPANSIWLWSPGRRPTMWTYRERFGLTGAVISAVDLVRGLGLYAGLEVITVEGATGLYDTNYEGKAEAALEALERLDFCYLHIEAPDEAGHEGDLELKIRTIEDLDARLTLPLLKGLEERGLETVVAILPDHPTPVEERIHTREAVPFAIRDPRQSSDSVQAYDEISCASGDYGQLHGDAFIQAVLRR
jgi:2,3-bisphosphoglycerate-independent phosphoglycerate mutase